MTNSNANPFPVAVKTNSAYEHRGEHQRESKAYTNMSAPEATLLAAVLSAIIVSLGWFAVHRNTRTREQEARAHADRKDKNERKATLLHALKHWENTFVILTDPAAAKRQYYTDGGMRALAEAVELFRHHVADQSTFDRLNHRMSQINPEALDANGMDKRHQTVCAAIREFYEFIKAA